MDQAFPIRADAGIDLSSPLIVGFGVVGRALARQLTQRGYAATVFEDNPTTDKREAAQELGVALIECPDEIHVKQSLALASVLLPSPGVPDAHPAIRFAKEIALPMRSEFDLARLWDERPVVAITGTNGKTSVTMMVTDALTRSGITAAAVGNTEVPLITAIDDPEIETFVVEASSFRLGHTATFEPTVATWLNFSPDHLDAHESLASYEAAKAHMWDDLPPGAVAVGNIDDPTVERHLDRAVQGNAGVSGVSYSTRSSADWMLDSSDEATRLVGPDGFSLAVADIPRRRPHDLSNALAVLATSIAAGATIEAATAAVTGFDGLPHRLQFVARHGGVEWYNDSKATVPEAAVAAISGFNSVVLIAGGRNKGLDLSIFATCVPPIRHVVATGDAGGEIAELFRGRVPVTMASSMAEAVASAGNAALPGDAVLLSPGCTSFDWYRNYGARGDDYMALVHQHLSQSA